MTTLITIAETVRRAAGTLARGSASPRLDAEVLLGTVLGISRSGLIVRAEEPLGEEAARAYAALIEQRVRGAPVAYLTGTREFWSLPLKVTPAVLVPRPETELLVEQALHRLPHEAERTVLDLGTGSGAVALALASERPRIRVTGVDVSAGALEVARENARILGLTEIAWRLGSWFDAVPAQRFDLVVSNPPYVADGDPALESLAAEPALALASGPTGFEALAAIARSAARHLRPAGWLLLEHGSTQALEVARLLEDAGFGQIESHHDRSGLPRVTLGQIHSSH